MSLEPRVIQRIRQRREGGHTTRCHTVPHIGTYDVAQHSWHAAVLLSELHPGASKELLLHVLLHDVQERWTGDAPAFAKWAFKDVGAALWKAEEKVSKAIGVCNTLTPYEAEWAKAVDVLELWMWCLDQEAIGNCGNVGNLKVNISRWASEHREKLPMPAWHFFKQYGWQRESDILEVS